MSVIRKKPFIESVIESLTDEQKASLLSVMNGSGNTIDASFTNLPEANVAPVLFQLEPNNLKTGILIQSETYDVLLAYHRFQDMQIYNLDLSKFTYEKINEYLDINELRRALGINVIPTPTTVIANPELAGTESPLTGLQVGSTKYAVDVGTEVVANPTLAGTESALTGLQVGNTKYTVPSGSFNIYYLQGFTYTNSILISCFYITPNTLPELTLSALRSDLTARGFTHYNTTIRCISQSTLSGSNFILMGGIELFNSTYLSVHYSCLKIYKTDGVVQYDSVTASGASADTIRSITIKKINA